MGIKPRALAAGPPLLVAALLTLAAPAHANHIPGATYTGTAATGGTVSFDVSARGGAIVRFAWSGVPTDCGILTGSFKGSTPIVDHAFDLFKQQPGRPVTFAGSFPASQQAIGTLGKPGRGGCKSVGWTATTTAIAPPPPTSDEIAPAVDVRTSGRLRRDGGIRVWVGCPEEACHVTAGGRASIAGGGGTFRLKPYFRPSVSHGQTVPVEPKLSRRGVAAARRALRNGRRVLATVVVSAVDAARNRVVQRSTIALHL
jgi:hypothetical protein